MLKMRILIALIMLVVCSIDDIKTKQVNVSLILTVGVATSIFYILYETRHNMTGCRVCLNILISVLPGIFLLLFSKILKGLGEGDGYLIISLGIITGVDILIKTLYLSFFVAGMYAVYLRVFKRADNKTKFAFVPFITIGFITCLALEIVTKKVL